MMSNNTHERIRQIKSHINQLLSELHRIDPNSYSPQNVRSFTSISHETCRLEHQCPYLSRQQTILHSTTYHEFKKFQQRKKPHSISSPKKHFLASTPKNSSHENLFLQPHLTSTPRRKERASTKFIPLKRLLYNQRNAKDANRPRHSTKRSILPPYSPPIDEHPQWI